MGFLSSLVDRAADVARIRRFFGFVAYVIDALEAAMPGQNRIQIPSHIKRIRPRTAPLTGEEQERMLRYKEEKDDMRNG
jgi:hypothetical protein